MQEPNKNPKRTYNLDIKRLDPKELNYSDIKTKAIKLPSIVDLRTKMPAVYDQGSLGSCTAQSFCAAYQYLKPQLQGSRLFMYYNTRLIGGTVSYDSGATLYDTIKSIKNYGICPETKWPYVIGKFTTKPSPECYKIALANKNINSYNVKNDLNLMRTHLNEGLLLVIGIAVYSEFETNAVAKRGYVPLPGKNSTFLGGHAVVVVGYNDTKKVWIVRNSWGSSWGDKGYFYLPYSYLTNPSLCSDIWYITLNNLRKTTDSVNKNTDTVNKNTDIVKK